MTSVEIRFLGHSSFLVTLPELQLMFDWFAPSPDPALAVLPEEALKAHIRRDIPLLVLASHSHGDHYSPCVFRLADPEHSVTYALGKGIRPPANAMERGECRIAVFKPGDTAELCGATVRAFASTDAGVAFFVSTPSAAIYHGGDLNDWAWDGEPEHENSTMTGQYRAEVRRVAAYGRPDIAFLPVDPRQGDRFADGALYYLHTVHPRFALPMHMWGDTSVPARLVALPEMEPYRHTIRAVITPGGAITLPDD